jgi:carbon-monoxide dehydrogenase catalytic subunit
MKEDMVNIVIHGHEPVLSEMIVAVAQAKEMNDYAKSKGAKGIQLSGICCTANEMLQRHGVPLCGTFLQQELAIITGACDAMVVDIQCIFQNLANVAKCFHTRLITTHPIARMEQENVIHIEFDEHHALEDAERIVKLAIDNFKNRGSEVMIPKQKAPIVAGFGVESVEYHLGGTFRGSYYTLNDNIINGRIRGIGGVVGCNNVRTRHNDGHITVVKELIKNDVIVLTTGCNAIACAMEGLLTPESAFLLMASTTACMPAARCPAASGLGMASNSMLCGLTIIKYGESPKRCPD